MAEEPEVVPEKDDECVKEVRDALGAGVDLGLSRFA